MGVIIKVGIAIIALAVAGLILWWYLFKWKPFQQFTVIIWGRDGFGNVVETKDKAGIFEKKSLKTKRFWLKKNKIGLNCDDVPFIYHGGKKTVYLLQVGHKNFRFIRPRFDWGSSSLGFKVGEENVNWAATSYQQSKRLGLGKLLLEYMPYIAIFFVTICIMVIFIMLFKKLDVLASFGKSMAEVARLIAETQTGTVAIQ